MRHLWRMRHRLAILALESLNSSLAQSTGELWSCKDLANMGKLCLLMRNLAGLKGVDDFSYINVIIYYCSSSALNNICNLDIIMQHHIVNNSWNNSNLKMTLLDRD